jgi:ubiquinone biosynthesis protein UbiJ
MGQVLAAVYEELEILRSRIRRVEDAEAALEKRMYDVERALADVDATRDTVDGLYDRVGELEFMRRIDPSERAPPYTQSDMNYRR